MRNVPDDWGMYYYKCSRCNSRYHASEGGCYCLEDHEKCVECDDYHHLDDLKEFGSRFYCEEHAVCEVCEDEMKDLSFCREAEVLICKSCKEN